MAIIVNFPMKNGGSFHSFSWENSLLWPFSIVMLNYQMVQLLPEAHKFLPGNLRPLRNDGNIHREGTCYSWCEVLTEHQRMENRNIPQLRSPFSIGFPISTIRSHVGGTTITGKANEAGPHDEKNRCDQNTKGPVSVGTKYGSWHILRSSSRRSEHCTCKGKSHHPKSRRCKTTRAQKSTLRTSWPMKHRGWTLWSSCWQ